MPCIHGLDEINCPTCRSIKSTLPNNSLSNIKTPDIKIGSPFFNQKTRINSQIAEELLPKRFKTITHPVNPIQKPFLINEIPNFENQLLRDRFQELDISKDDNFGISKKIQLEKPEWQFEEED
ncbi:MAG: hypothetical protein KGD58_04700 [Candidatus Lokiarchaeota archaeon]|nr:hypothetical protein [Candidatus Lokiarchaeota archaeon]